MLPHTHSVDEQADDGDAVPKLADSDHQQVLPPAVPAGTVVGLTDAAVFGPCVPNYYVFI